MPAYLHPAGDAIFVEAIAPVSAGVVCPFESVYLLMTLPGGQTFRIINRMMIDILAMDFSRVYGFVQIQRHAKLLRRPDAL